LSAKEIPRLLGEWKGYRIDTVGRFPAGDKGPEAEVWIELLPLHRIRMRCSCCGTLTSKVHDLVERRVSELPILDAVTRLLVWRRRVRCPNCGPKLEELEWMGRYSRITKRLAESVGRLCKMATLSHVAEFFGLSWWRVKAIDKIYLSERLGPVDLSGVEVIAMDEFTILKGQRYAAVIKDPRTKRVLWVGRGRGRESTQR